MVLREARGEVDEQRASDEGRTRGGRARVAEVLAQMDLGPLSGNQGEVVDVGAEYPWAPEDPGGLASSEAASTGYTPDTMGVPGGVYEVLAQVALDLRAAADEAALPGVPSTLKAGIKNCAEAVEGQRALLEQRLDRIEELLCRSRDRLSAVGLDGSPVTAVIAEHFTDRQLA